MIGAVNAAKYHRQERVAFSVIGVLMAIAIGLLYYAITIDTETAAPPASPQVSLVLHWPRQLIAGTTHGFDDVLALLNGK